MVGQEEGTNLLRSCSGNSDHSDFDLVVPDVCMEIICRCESRQALYKVCVQSLFHPVDSGKVFEHNIQHGKKAFHEAETTVMTWDYHQKRKMTSTEGELL